MTWAIRVDGSCGETESPELSVVNERIEEGLDIADIDAVAVRKVVVWARGSRVMMKESRLTRVALVCLFAEEYFLGWTVVMMKVFGSGGCCNPNSKKKEKFS